MRESTFSLWLQKPLVKNLLLSILVLIIGGICSAMGSWDRINDKLFWYKLFALVVSAIVYIVLLVFYGTKEVNNRRVISILKNQNSAYDELLANIISICKETASDVTTVIRQIKNSGIINLETWNFDKACNAACRSVYNITKNICGSADIAVAYVRLDDSEYPAKKIYLNSFANQTHLRPSIFGKKRIFSEEYPNSYHDVDLFRSGSSEIEIVIGNENIDNIFAYTDKGSHADGKKKYSQYVAIPVFCKDEKMVGLLEIVALNDAKIGLNVNEVREVALKYFVPQSYLFLLLYKLERSLLAKPG